MYIFFNSVLICVMWLMLFYFRSAFQFGEYLRTCLLLLLTLSRSQNILLILSLILLKILQLLMLVSWYSTVLFIYSVFKNFCSGLINMDLVKSIHSRWLLKQRYFNLCSLFMSHWRLNNYQLAILNKIIQ